ncbi:Rpn family recombination-promoting nuclease/putative transposase [Paenibacillus physcomitrellae]|uniref:Transposase n=1 Tax=Paenibacillus physcomitrellae TaxID=1619311 RepID=A0ABQ1GHT5_9BACL|nr:Rpn family recombination-promoting nuclease/putative transposase [Paenibacillus physcomitrellae]GGA43517.1 transposase [Paenibacillus physcomitrellae]
MYDFLDPRCTSKGELANIEMQLFNPYHMEKRTLFYWSEMYYHQIPKGGNYNTLQKCVTINILNYSSLPNDRYHSVFHLREDHTGIALLDDIEIHVIELTKLDPQKVTLNEGGLINWLMFLKGADKSNWEVLTVKEPMLKKAMNTLEFLSQDTAARMAYDARMKALSDEKSRIESAMKVGREEGKVEGKAEGKAETALKLLEMGAAIEMIAEATGMTEEAIRALKPQQL